MILTGSAIVQARAAGDITIEPFDPAFVNPNSYNYRLSPTLLIAEMSDGKPLYRAVELGEEGYVLQPHRLYLASTLEELGSRKYAMSLIGRSSIGRLGLFLQVSANLGHTGSSHCWTLELVPAKPIRIYPRLRIGQISFWNNEGVATSCDSSYTTQNVPTISRWSKNSIIGERQ